MSNHIKKSPACHAKFQALLNLVQHYDATSTSQSTSISNLPMDTGDESTAMELDIQPPTPTDTDQLDVGATSDVDDPLLMMMTLICNQTSQSRLLRIN